MIPSRWRRHASLKLGTLADDVGGELHGASHRQFGEELLQDRFPLDQGQRAQLATIEVEDVEKDVSQLALPAVAPESFLEGTEVGDANEVDNQETAVGVDDDMPLAAAQFDAHQSSVGLPLRRFGFGSCPMVAALT